MIKLVLFGLSALCMVGILGSARPVLASPLHSFSLTHRLTGNGGTVNYWHHRHHRRHHRHHGGISIHL